MHIILHLKQRRQANNIQSKQKNAKGTYIVFK